MKRAALLTIAAVAVLAAGCATPPTTGPSATPTDPALPSPTATPAENIVLSIDTIATAQDGAALDIAVDVHRSLDVADPAASELRATLTDACGPDFVTDEKLDSESWGLVRIDVAAEATDGPAWPAEVPLSLVTAPRGDPGAAAIGASGGPIETPTDPAGELGPCLVDHQLTGEGEGYLVLGIRGDFESEDAQGVFWNGYRYGVSSLIFGERTDVTFSECLIEKTPLGDQLAAPEIGYTEQANATECSAGVPPAA